MIVQPYYDGDIVNDIIERMIPMSLNDSFNDDRGGPGWVCSCDPCR